ncbi:hypothetical protein DM01DRAFT_1410627 [Hesseltinella vesiculosa]|uniref:Pali-domain-containing protein n=1 Tax=Hesseltinella vesiculosa TaxID=101127 RepID=A0A1X2G6W6_9FUNG|nr:hypothetical protein DM01DRAFT_1410627 [Hesseltinella vesiculosa]
MLHGCFSLLGSLFTFASFILHLFIIIGQLSNKPLINRLSFVHFYDRANQQQLRMGLWNYCTADTSGNLEVCSQPVAAYNWFKTPGLSAAIHAPRFSTGLFMALFILLFIGLGLSFLMWLLSIPLAFVRHKAVGSTLSTILTIAFLADLAALIIALVLILSGIANITDDNWNGHAGNSLWLTIGAVMSLLFSFLTFGCSCCAIRDTRGAGGKGRVDPNWKETNRQSMANTSQGGGYASGVSAGYGGANVGQTGATSGNYDMNQSLYHTVNSPAVHQQQQQQMDMQQGYYAANPNQYAPALGQQTYEHQQTSGTFHDASDHLRPSNYQTPVLQQADIPTDSNRTEVLTSTA